MSEPGYGELEARVAALEHEVALLRGAAPATPGNRLAVVCGTVTLVAIALAIGTPSSLEFGTLSAGIGILIGLALGLALVLGAATRLPASAGAYADTLILLGSLFVYGSLAATIFEIAPYAVSHVAVFVGAVGMTVLLAALAIARRSERLAAIAAVGGFAIPYVVGPIGAPPQLVLAALLVALCAATLFVAFRFGFVSLEFLALAGVIAGGVWLAPNGAFGWSVPAAQTAAKLLLFVLAVAYAIGPRADGAGSAMRRGGLIAASVLIYAVAIEVWMHGSQRAVGFDLIGLAAAMLVATMIRAWAPPIGRAFTAGAIGSGALAAISLVLGFLPAKH